jgi:hypothetical protein
MLQNQGEKKLDTKEIFAKPTRNENFKRIYNLINGAKLWYQMMRPSWSHGQATHTQRHQFPESQVNQVW